MLDEENGELMIVAKAQDEVAELVDLLVVETACRLVEQQQARLRDQRPCDLHPLLDPVRQRRRHVVGALPEADVSSVSRASLSLHPTAESVGPE